MDSKKIRYLIWKNNTQQRMRRTISRNYRSKLLITSRKYGKIFKKRFDETKNQFP